ncbi:MAG: methyltransferase domain-containing protein, partial [Frankiaceae bacterium]|nr:methyltransferase domain-containing protein [Frankiaceae bacterium]
MSANDTAHRSLDWSTVAEGWDSNRQLVETVKTELSRQLVEGLALTPGDSVLELGAGTGEFARQLSAAVGDGGRVLATDYAAGMVELIERTTADLPNTRAMRLDAADIGPVAEPFDAIAFRFGLMLVPDPGTALTESRRVLRAGGRFAATTWAAPEHNMWLVSVGMSAMLNGMVSGPMPTEPGGPLSLGDPDQLEKLAQVAGFSEVSVKRVDVIFRTRDVDSHIAHVTQMA